MDYEILMTSFVNESYLERATAQGFTDLSSLRAERATTGAVCLVPMPGPANCETIHGPGDPGAGALWDPMKFDSEAKVKYHASLYGSS